MSQVERTKWHAERITELSDWDLGLELKKRETSQHFCDECTKTFRLLVAEANRRARRAARASGESGSDTDDG